MIEFSRHARERMEEYGISEACVSACLANPVFMQRDPLPDRVRYYGCCTGRRYAVRVVVLEHDRKFVVTAHPDHKVPCPNQ